jgi:myosin heavy subunit
MGLPKSFLVCHYAGEVEYEISSFNEKNKDTVSDVINDTLFASKSELLSMLFAKPP